MCSRSRRRSEHRRLPLSSRPGFTFAPEERRYRNMEIFRCRKADSRTSDAIRKLTSQQFESFPGAQVLSRRKPRLGSADLRCDVLDGDQVDGRIAIRAAIDTEPVESQGHVDCVGGHADGRYLVPGRVRWSVDAQVDSAKGDVDPIGTVAWAFG